MAILNVVKYDGAKDIFAWKHPDCELTTASRLIVNESQEAFLFQGGVCYDQFGPGSYTLETQNIPMLQAVINLPYGKKSPFSAEIWFVNRLYVLDMKWGTASPIQIQDPRYGIFVPVRSYGQFGMQIVDARRFLLRLVGTLPSFSKQDVTNYFRGLYLTKVKDCISNWLVQKKVSVVECSAHLEEISVYIEESLAPTFLEYGIHLVNFYVNDINMPEEDPSVIQLKRALAKRAEMDIVGFGYAQERSFDTLEKAAENQGTGGDMMNAGMGLGMGMGLTGAMSQAGLQLADVLNIKPTSANTKENLCSNCGQPVIEGARFCGNCGKDQSMNEVNVCAKCGEKIPEGAKFCPHCGTSCEKTQDTPSCPYCHESLTGRPSFCPHCGKKIDDGPSE